MTTPWEIADQAQRMLAEAQQARQQAAAMLARAERTRDELTGVALWCSTGEHSFSQQDRKRATFTVESFDDDGNPVTEKALMCGPCADKRREAIRNPPPQLAAVPAGVDRQEYTEYLEWKNHMRDQPPAPAPAGSDG